MEKFAAKWQGWMTPVKRLQAKIRLDKMKKTPKPKKIHGDMEDFRQKVLKAIGATLVAGGGTAYAINRATKRDEPKYEPSPYGGGGGTM